MQWHDPHLVSRCRAGQGVQGRALRGGKVWVGAEVEPLASQQIRVRGRGVDVAVVCAQAPLSARRLPWRARVALRVVRNWVRAQRLGPVGQQLIAGVVGRHRHREQRASTAVGHVLPIAVGGVDDHQPGPSHLRGAKRGSRPRHEGGRARSDRHGVVHRATRWCGGGVDPIPYGNREFRPEDEVLADKVAPYGPRARW
eukprot:SAG31_NODE_329_length_17643_cov_10.377793_9_plen_198_part_00